MNKTLLKQLYDGEVYPAEQIVPKDSEYWELCRKLGEERNYLREQLSVDVRERFEEIETLSQEIANLYSYENFSCGFRLGIGLIMESFSNSTEISATIHKT